MLRFVALLRGINVGKAKRIAMADLRALLSGLGYTNVATLLNSGNAVFHAANGVTTAQHATDISTAISDQLKVDVPVIVKSARELTNIISESPIMAEVPEHSRFLVALVQDTKVLSGLEAIRPLLLPLEHFAVGRNAAYLLCVGGILKSKAGKALLGKAGRSATTRNWATVLKLHALATEHDA